MADCIPVGGFAGNFAKKMGGELVRNPDGVYVLKGMGASETIFPDEASAIEHLQRTLQNATLNAEDHFKIDEAVRFGNKIPITDIEAIIKHTDDMQRSSDVLGGGEQPPAMARIGISRGGFISRFFHRQHAVLMESGEGGRKLANDATRFDTTREMIEHRGEMRLGPLGDALDRIASMDEINNRVAHPEALKLWDKVFGEHASMVDDMRDFLGIPEELMGGQPGKRKISWFGLRAADIDAPFVKAAQDKGILTANEGPDELASRYNSPDFGVKPPHMTNAEWQRAQAWLKTRGADYAGEANHMRSGEGYMKSVKQTLLAWNRNVSRRLAEAAVFGPDLSRIHEAVELINNEKGNVHANYASKIMQDIRGKVYIPRSNLERQLVDLTRGMLASSGTRHIAQMKMPIMQFGWGRSVGTVAKDLFDVGNWKGTHDEFNQLAVSLRHAQYSMDEHPSDRLIDLPDKDIKGLLDWSKQFGKDVPAAIAKFGTAGLHIFLNTGRMIAASVARGNFESYFAEALKGDQNKLGLMADVFGFGDSTTPKGRAEFVEHLKAMDKDQARDYFIKRIADIEGTTFNPKDHPGFARSPMGKWLSQFRIFRWNVVHNVWNQMTSPNYTKMHRAVVTMRFLSTIPTLSAIDPAIRATKIAGVAGIGAALLSVGQANVDSKLAHDSFEKAIKANGKTSERAYAAIQLAINDGSLGIASDMLQGWNMMNPDIFNRALVSGNIPILDEFTNIGIGSALAVHGSLSGDRKEKRRAAAMLMSDAPLGSAIAKAVGFKEKDPRVPHKQAIKKTLEAGAQAVGLQ